MWPKLIVKGFLFAVMRDETKKQNINCSTSVANVHAGQGRNFCHLSMSRNLCESVMSTDFGLTNKF